MKQLIWSGNQKDGSGKRISFPAVLFIGFFFLFALICGKGTLWAQAATATPITMDVSCGFGDQAKGDRYIPVRISFENKESGDFSGMLEILTTASSREVYRYDYPVQIAGKETSEELYYIPLGVKGDQLFVSLRDEGGNEVIRKRVKLNISKDASEVFIGVLSDEPDSLLYFDGVGIRFGSIKTQVISLNPEILPEDPRGFDQLDMIMINDYELDKLTKAKQVAMMNWVENGGTLLFGGGDSYKSNMGDFASELLEGSYEIPTLRQVNLGAEYSQNAPQDAVLDLVCADLSLKNGRTLIVGDGFPLLSFSHRKQGRIAVAAFDLRDVEEFSRTHPVFTEKMLIMILGESRISELSQQDFYGFSSLYYSAQGLINTGNVDRLPNVILYTVTMILYVLLIGPGLYLALRGKSLQRYYIGGVALCALLFTAMIYIIGSKTRFKEPFFTYATIRDMSEEGASEETFVNVRSPFNKPYTVSLNPEYVVRPITKSYYYDSFSVSEFTGAEDYKTAVISNEEKTELKIRDAAAFAPKMFSLQRDIDGLSGAGIGNQVRFFDGKVNGTIKNVFDYKLEDAVLLFYGGAVLLGDIEPDQEIELKDTEVLSYPLNYTYAFAQTVTGADQYEKADISDEAYMLAQERTRLLSFYMDNSMEEYSPEARLVAFSPNQNKKEFLLEDNYVTEGITLITASVGTSREQDGLLYRSALEQEPNVISGNYQARYNSMYTGEPSEPAVIEYSLGNDLKVEKLTFKYLASIFEKNPKYPYVSGFQGKMYFYNYDTGRNDLIEANKNEFTAGELDAYLSPTNTITIKYVNESTSEYGWDRLLPIIYVIGREK